MRKEKKMTEHEILNVFKSVGLGNKKQEPYTNAQDYAKNIQRCTILKESNIVYASSASTSK